MTKPEEALKVTQADREAAVAFLDDIERRKGSGVKVLEVLDCEDGSPHPLAQAFARHRIEHSPTPARNEVLEEAAVDWDWLEAEVEAIPTRYHGDPSYDHDAYWFKCEVRDLLAKARAFSPALTPTPEPTNPAGVSGVVRDVARAVMVWGAPHFKHMVSFNVLQEAIEPVIAAALSRTPAPDAGLREALEKLADVVERLTDAIERQEHDIGGESVAAVLPDLGPAYDHARAALSQSPRPDDGMLEEVVGALEQLVEYADLVPKKTPAAGGAGTEHNFKISAGIIWTLDERVQAARATLARVRQGKGGNDATG